MITTHPTPGLVIHKTVTANFTADEYQLFTHSMDCRGAAIDLNKAIAKAINEDGLMRPDARKAIAKVQREHSKYGANDSEPDWMIERVLDVIYAEVRT